MLLQGYLLLQGHHNAKFSFNLKQTHLKKLIKVLGLLKYKHVSRIGTKDGGCQGSDLNSLPLSFCGLYSKTHEAMKVHMKSCIDDTDMDDNIF